MSIFELDHTLNSQLFRTHLFRVAIFLVSLLLFLEPVQAQPARHIVNIDAQTHVSPETALAIPFTAGTYQVHVIGKAAGGQFDGWSSNCLTRGCTADGYDCRKGWEHQYTIRYPQMLTVPPTDRYASSDLAMQNPPPDQRLRVATDREILFYVYNPGSPENNRGGVSLQIDSVN